MSSKNSKIFATLMVVAFAVAAASALPYEPYENYAPLENDELLMVYYDAPAQLRVARSPQGGSVDLGVQRDRFGTVGSAQYNHNLWSANNGNSRLDAYAQASKNFDHHGRPNYGGGLTFQHRF